MADITYTYEEKAKRQLPFKAAAFFAHNAAQLSAELTFAEQCFNVTSDRATANFDAKACDEAAAFFTILGAELRCRNGDTTTSFIKASWINQNPLLRRA